MKTIANFIKKHDNIFILLMCIIIASTFAFYMELDANDALWNFSNIYKMSNGYKIYSEINVIITPLFFFIGKILFKIMGTNYITFSIYQTSIIYTFLFYIIYQLYKKLEIRKLNAVLCTVVISIISIFTIIDASYNMLAIAFVILGILVILNKKQNIINNIIQGIIIFLIFMTKQNIGILYFIGIIIAQILISEKRKSTYINILIQITTFSCLMGVYLLYLQTNNNLYPFINYCFLGIKEFSSKNIKYNIKEIMLNIMSIIISFSAIILTYNKKMPLKKQEKNYIRVLGTISIFMVAVTYPIMNAAHTLIANITFMVLLGYLLETFIMRELLAGNKTEKMKKVIIILLFSISLIYNLIYNTNHLVKITNKDYYFEKNSPYYGVLAQEETVKEIGEIVKYIEEQDSKGINVKIISCYSNLYMNILQKNNGKLDLPFYGNMGKEGEKGIIKELDNLKNTKILIITEEKNKHRQESEKILQYIKEKFELEGTISKFSIYKSK